MLRVVIGHSSKYFAQSVARRMGGDFDIRTCDDGEAMGPLLDAFRPDILILDCAMPCKDTLAILTELPVLPQLTVLTTDYVYEDMEWQMRTLGVERILVMATPSEVVRVVCGFVPKMGKGWTEDSGRVRLQLLALNFDTNLEGFRLICSAVPLMMQDTGRVLSKDIYPQVARLNNLSDQRAVERAIRNAIEKAWRYRDEAVWDRFFPGQGRCLSNRKLLTALVQWLKVKGSPARADGSSWSDPSPGSP